MTVYKKLEELGITLPPVATPAAAYVPFVVSDSHIYLSGHIAKKEGKVWVGQLGLTMQTPEGADAAVADMEVVHRQGGGGQLWVSRASMPCLAARAPR